MSITTHHQTPPLRVSASPREPPSAYFTLIARRAREENINNVINNPSPNAPLRVSAPPREPPSAYFTLIAHRAREEIINNVNNNTSPNASPPRLRASA